MANPRKVPQDHKKSGDESMFHWTAPDGTNITLPRLESLQAGQLRKYRKLEETDQLFSILEDELSKSELAKVDALTVVELNQMYAAWKEAAAVTIPQS